MTRNISLFYIILSLAGAISLPAAAQPSAQENARLTLHYDSPADVFERALVIGNGTFGGAIYGSPVEDRISLNDLTLWTGEPETHAHTDRSKALADVREALFREDYKAAHDLCRELQGHNSQNYEPLGTLKIRYSGHEKVSDYRRSLDISDATARTAYLVDGKKFECEYIASAPDSAIVIRLRTEAPEGISAVISLDGQLPHECSADGGCAVSDGYAAYHSHPDHAKDATPLLYDPARGIHFRTAVKAVPLSGKAAVNPDGTISLEGCGEVLVFVANVTSFNGFDKDPVKEGRDYKTQVMNRIGDASAKAWSDLLSAHTADYRQYFDRVKLDLGRSGDGLLAMDMEQRLMNYLDRSVFDPDLETLYYQFGRYLLISSSRTPGVPPNLQGIWNEMVLPPWSSNYTININLEENFWGAKTGNLLEMQQSLLQFVRNMAVDGKTTAKAFYGIDEGWCSGHNSDIWAMTNPVGNGKGSPQWSNWTMGGAWLSFDIWENYAYSKDKEELKKNYETLKGAALFCLNWMIERNGELITAPATSPENVFFYNEKDASDVCYGGTADLAIIRECLMDAHDAAKALHRDRKLRRRIRRTLAKMHPYSIGSDGNLQEWYHDWKDPEPKHRHHSHMIGLYPGHSIDPAVDTALARACSRTLDIRGDHSSGWSTGWKMNLHAHLGHGDRAYSIYRNLLSYKDPAKVNDWLAGGTFPNFLDAHPPFQIDGNFGGSAGVTEMLMQSTMKEITLLPALPGQWKEGSVSGILARGGFEVGFSWSGGKVTEVRVYSAHGGKTLLRFNGQTRKIRLRAGDSIILS